MRSNNTVALVVLVALVLTLSSTVASAQARRPLPRPVLVGECLATTSGSSLPCRIVVAPRGPLGPQSEGDERPPLSGRVFLGASSALFLDDVAVTLTALESSDGEDGTAEETEGAGDEGVRKAISLLTASVGTPQPRSGDTEASFQVQGELSIAIEPLTLDDGRIVPQVTGTLTVTDDDERTVSYTLKGRLAGPRPPRGAEERADEDEGAQAPEVSNEAVVLGYEEPASALEDF